MLKIFACNSRLKFRQVRKCPQEPNFKKMIVVPQIALNNKTKQVDKKACSSHWPQFNFLTGVCIKIQSACASWRAEITNGASRLTPPLFAAAARVNI
jgi:hypothetical protein